ncbi:MAG: hypothetical protein WCT16_01580 [Candidatus Buchananbacteria bacterium]
MAKSKRKRLVFEYCECGCKCYTANGRKNSYSIFWDLRTGDFPFHLRVNNGDWRHYQSYKGAKIAANNTEKAT